MKIIDDTLFPYEIVIDQLNHIVQEDTGKLDKQGEQVYKNHGYFGNLESALSKVIGLKLINLEKTHTLAEYIEQYKLIKKQIKEAIKF
jgi:hypothetical protein